MQPQGRSRGDIFKWDSPSSGTRLLCLYWFMARPPPWNGCVWIAFCVTVGAISPPKISQLSKRQCFGANWLILLREYIDSGGIAVCFHYLSINPGLQLSLLHEILILIFELVCKSAFWMRGKWIVAIQWGGRSLLVTESLISLLFFIELLY
jgi:hypothetical protein